MSACTSIVCDNCIKPGSCCKLFSLGGGAFGRGKTELEVLVQLATVQTCADQGRAVVFDGLPHEFVTDVLVGLPFIPSGKEPDGSWRFSCIMLDHRGRCSDYENRPALCRSYQALDDAMCAMHPEHNENFLKA